MTEKNRGALADRNSLEDKAANDPELQRKLHDGRLKADSDLAAMEHWARKGFNSGGVIEEDS